MFTDTIGLLMQYDIGEAEKIIKDLLARMAVGYQEGDS